MLPVNESTIWDIVPVYKSTAGISQAAIIAGIGPILQARLEESEINTSLRIAHFLAQCAHESAGFRTLVEFSSGTQYNGRHDLGNTQSNDGPRYKGRGLLEITGRANYRALGEVLGLDLENNPKLLEEPELALRASCAFWAKHNLNRCADNDDLIAATRIINGGQNGLDSRRAFLGRAKAAVAKLRAASVATTGKLLPNDTFQAPPSSEVILHRGAQGDNVVLLQQMLRAKFPTLPVDGFFGGATELAVVEFQRDYGLTQDGIVGKNTWQRLTA